MEMLRIRAVTSGHQRLFSSKEHLPQRANEILLFAARVCLLSLVIGTPVN
jgi:hypothetical protein